MNDKIEVKSGKIEDDKVLNLLNMTRVSWGDIKFLKWIYHNNPNVENDENFFALTDNDELIGFERISYKEVLYNNCTQIEPIFIYKNGTVDPKYQGKGVYSGIIKLREKYFNNNDVNYKMAFIRKSNLPFRIHRDRNWRYRILPLFMYIISPLIVIKNYSKFFLEKSKSISLFAKIFGRRVNLVFHNDSVNLSELFDGFRSKGLVLNIYLSNVALKKLIEDLTGRILIRDVIFDLVKLFLFNEISFFKKNDFFVLDKKQSDKFIIEIKEELNEDEISVLEKLYLECLKKFDVVFRRNFRDIFHILSYPKITDIILVKKNNKIVGFSIVGYAKEDNIRELRVFDIIYNDEEVFDVLVDEIEKIGRDRDLISIHLFSNEKLNDKWIYIPETAVMWKSKNVIEDLEILFEKGNWKISHYDVL